MQAVIGRSCISRPPVWTRRLYLTAGSSPKTSGVTGNGLGAPAPAVMPSGHRAVQGADWEGFPPEIATWEEEDQIPCGEVDFVAQYDAAQEAAEAGETEEVGSDDDSDDEV